MVTGAEHDEYVKLGQSDKALEVRANLAGGCTRCVSTGRVSLCVSQECGEGWQGLWGGRLISA